MELDDLKKSWSALDKQLQKENIVDEKQIAELIAQYQAKATKGIRKLTGLQRISLIIGVIGVLAGLCIVAVETSFFSEMKMNVKVIVMTVFALVTIILGFTWDIKTYRFSRNTKVDEMSTLEVIERMNKFRKWTKYEVVTLIFWIAIFFVLYYWLSDYYMQPITVQVAFISGSLVIIGILFLFLYKKIFRFLNDVKKNLDELKELEGGE